MLILLAPLRCDDHADPDGLGRRRFGRGPGASGYAFEPVRRVLCGGRGTGAAGGLHQAEYRRRGLCDRYRLAVAPPFGRKPTIRSSCRTPNWRRRSSPTTICRRNGWRPISVVTVDYDCDPDRVEACCWRCWQAVPERFPGCWRSRRRRWPSTPALGTAGIGFHVNFQVAEFASQGPVRNELRRGVTAISVRKGSKFRTHTERLSAGARSQVEAAEAAAKRKID